MPNASRSGKNDSLIVKSRSSSLEGITKCSPACAKQAGDAFVSAHQVLCGTPSGTTSFDIIVSNDPREWSYHSQISTSQKLGPQTPRQRLDPNCADVFKNIIHLTNLAVTACISPIWAKAEWKDSPWEKAVFRHPSQRLIPLGAVPITTDLPAPADAAWQIECVMHIGGGKFEYSAIKATRFAVALGTHITLTDNFATAGQELIKQLQKTAAQRMHGTGPKSGTQILDEVDIPVFGAFPSGRPIPGSVKIIHAP